MKTKSITALLIILVLILTGCSKPADFRNASWGDSPAKVDKGEETEYGYADETIVIYDEVYEGQPVEIYYMFEDNALVEAQMKFITNERLLEEVIDAYYLMEEALTELYGEPISGDREIWLNKDSEYAADIPQVPIYHNDLMYKTEWETETTYAYLLLECIDKRNIGYYYYACDINNK